MARFPENVEALQLLRLRIPTFDCNVLSLCGSEDRLFLLKEGKHVTDRICQTRKSRHVTLLLNVPELLGKGGMRRKPVSSSEKEWKRYLKDKISSKNYLIIKLYFEMDNFYDLKVQEFL